MPADGTPTAPADTRQMRIMLAAMTRLDERLRALETATWLEARWGIDGDALRFFASYATTSANYPTQPDAFAAGFLLALEIADDPELGRPTLTVA